MTVNNEYDHSVLMVFAYDTFVVYHYCPLLGLVHYYLYLYFAGSRQSRNKQTKKKTKK